MRNVRAVRHAVLGSVVALLAACGSSGSGPNGQPDAGDNTASLVLTVSGLPANAPADITLSGPGGFSKHATVSQTLGVPPGSYTVSANGVRVPGATVDSASDAQVSNPSFTVATGQSASASVTYTRRPGTGLFWIPSPLTGTVSAFAPAALAVGNAADGGKLTPDAGAPAASVTLSVRLADGGPLFGPELVTFDRTGRLWVALDNEGSGVEELIAYPASALGSSGAPAPSVVLKPSDAGAGSLSLRFPVAMAFDATGNLWLANLGGASNSLVKFDAAALTASGAPAPALVWRGPGLQGVDGLAFDAQGNLWVATCAPTISDVSAVYEFSSAQLSSPTMPAPSVRIVGSSSFGCPEGLAFDAAGGLWVAENGAVKGVGGYPKGQLLDGGSTGGGNDPLVVVTGPFNGPTGLGFDNGGNLWVTDFPHTLIGIPKAQLAVGGTVHPVSSFQIPELNFAQPAFNLLPHGLPGAP